MLYKTSRIFISLFLIFTITALILYSDYTVSVTYTVCTDEEVCGLVCHDETTTTASGETSTYTVCGTECHIETHCSDVTDTYTIDEAVDPEELEDLIEELEENSEMDIEVDITEEVPGDLDENEDEANDEALSLEDFQDNLEQDIEDNINNTNNDEEISNDPPDKDPVRIATGDYYWEKIDLAYEFINSDIEIDRIYQTNTTSSHSFGLGWNFNYDTRIVKGVKPLAQEEVELLEQKLVKITQLYNDSLTAYNTSLNNMQNHVLPRVLEIKEIVDDSVAGLQYAISHASSRFTSLLTGHLNNALEKQQIVNTFLSRSQTALTNLQNSYYLVENIRLIKEDFEQILDQSKNELNMADSNLERNKYVFNNTDPLHQQYSGNLTVTLIDESGIPHLYYIDNEPDYNSIILYPDGSINYFINGTGTTPSLPNDDELFIMPDGSYQLILKDKTVYYYTFYGQLEKITDTNKNNILFVYNENHELVKITDAFNRSIMLDRENGRIVKATDPKNREILYNYDSSERLISVIDAEGDKIQYEYNENLVTKIIKPDESFREYIYTDLDGKMVISKTIDEEGNYDIFNYFPESGYTEYVNPSGIFERHYYNDRNLKTKIEYADGSFVEMEYDDDNNLTKQTDQLGRIYRYSYDENRNLTESIDPAGNIEKWTYNDFNRVSSYTDKMGNTTYYSYDANGNLLNIQYPDLTTVYYSYNSLGQITEISDQAGNKTYYDYDSNGYVSSVTDAQGNTELYENDIIGNMIKATDSEGYCTSFEYNNDNKIVLITDSMGYTESFEYDNRKDLVQTIDKNGSITIHEYDNRHLLIKITNPLGEITDYQYREDGKMISKTIEGVNTNLYEYDFRGNLVKETQAETGVFTVYEYDKAGQLTAVTDPNGSRTVYGYNMLGLISWVKDPLGNDSFVDYYANSRISGKIDKLGNKTYFYYDNMNRLIKEIDPYYNEKEYQYDSRGNLVSSTDKNGNETEYEYDSLNRLIRETDPLGNSVSYRYDSRDLLLSVTDKNNNTTSYQYDSLRRLVKTIDPLSGVKEYTYDPEDNILTKTDENGNTRSYEYDNLNRIIKKTDSYGNYTLFTYDYLGDIQSVTDPLGNITDYQYDELGRLLSETDPPGAVKIYEYDNNSNLICVKDQLERPVYYEYDALNRIISKTNALGEIILYDYDANNNLITETDAKGNEYNYEYDNLNRLVKEINRPGDTQSYIYDPEDNLVNKTDFNGNITEYSYDSLNRLILTEFSDGTEETLTFDANSNILTAENETGILQYEYDELNRMVKSYDSATDEEILYGYDPAGNRTALTFNNRTTDYIYGSMNETLSVTDPEGDTTLFEYDALIREIKKTLPNNIITETTYDTAGRVICIKNYKTHHHDWNKEILESYVYLYNEAGEITYQVDNSGNITAYEYDELGRIKDAYYTFLSGKKNDDFEERLEMGLFPETEELTNNRWGRENHNSSIDLPDFFKPGLNDDDVFEGIEDILGAKEGFYKEYGNLNQFNKRWHISPVESEYITQLNLDYETKQELQEAFGDISSSFAWLNTDTWMWKESFSYDANNNRETKTNFWGSIEYTYNEENRILTSGNRHYEHDLNGNLIKETLGEIEGIYTYNPENRVTNIYTSFEGFLGCSGWELESGVVYTYDTFGRRNSRIEYNTKNRQEPFHEWEWNREKQKSYIYDGLGFNVIAEVRDNDFDINNNNHNNWGHHHSDRFQRLSEYVYANGKIIERTDFNEMNRGWENHHPQIKEREYYHQDILGSTIMLTDEHGNMKQTYNYDAFGNIYESRHSMFYGNMWWDMNPHSENTYLYNGKSLDQKVNLYNYGFRDYAPQLGRWTTADPIRDGDNWYVYCLNNPIKYIDLYGLEFILTITVDQPGSGGDRDTYENIDGQFVTGHVYVTLEDTDTGEKETKGFYGNFDDPDDNRKDVVFGENVPGEVIDDSGYDPAKVDAKVSFDITQEEYKSAKSYIDTIEKFTPEYDLEDYNCTDFVQNVSASAGVDLPDTEGSWTFGSGSNPGDLGEDLRELYGSAPYPKEYYDRVVYFCGD